MLNPPQSLVLTKLLMEVLTLCDLVLLILRSAVLHSVPSDGEFRFVNRGRVRSHDPFLQKVAWFVGFLSVCVFTEKHVLCRVATYPVNIPNCTVTRIYFLSN